MTISKSPLLKRILTTFLACLMMATAIIPASMSVTKSFAFSLGTPVTQPVTKYPSGMKSSGTVVDISSHNDPVNFMTLKSKGVKGIMMRGACGMKKDASFDNYYMQATALNIPVGVYQYVYWCLEKDAASAKAKAKQEAELLLSTLSGKWIRGYVALDIECYNVKNIHISAKEMTDVANYYMSIIRAAGYKPILYCNMKWLTEYLQKDNIQAPLWLAYYHDTGSYAFPDNKYGQVMNSVKNRVVMWQYTYKGAKSEWGSEGCTMDLNRLYYSFTG